MRFVRIDQPAQYCVSDQIADLEAWFEQVPRVSRGTYFLTTVSEIFCNGAAPRPTFRPERYLRLDWRTNDPHFLVV